jgi:hypothetical protein
LSLCLTKHHAMKTYWRVDIQRHAFLTSALDGDEWSASRRGRFTRREQVPGTHWIGDWVSHYTHTDTHPFKTQHNITQYREKFLKRGDVGCAKPHAQCTSNVKGMLFPKLILLFRTGFRSIRRSEIHMNIKLDLDAQNRRRRRFYLRCTCHIYQGLWWSYPGYYALV